VTLRKLGYDYIICTPAGIAGRLLRDCSHLLIPALFDFDGETTMVILIMILADCERLNEVVDAWMQAGVTGVTVMDSVGSGGKIVRDAPSPLYMGFSQMFGRRWVEHSTLLALLPTTEMADTAVAATEKIVGPLEDNGNGVAFVIPALKTWGLSEQ
jgi:nitrogen regulatory protein P-II 1